MGLQRVGHDWVTEHNAIKYIFICLFASCVSSLVKCLVMYFAHVLTKSGLIWLMCLLTQSCPTLCNTMDYSPPASSVHEIFQARNTGVGCHFFLQGSSQARDWTCVSYVFCIADRFFTCWPIWEVSHWIFFLFLMFVFSLHILDTHSLSNTWFSNIFFQFVAYFLIFLTVSFIYLK